jgi:hypothetical protein
MTNQELLQTIEQAAREGWEELDLNFQQLTALLWQIDKLSKRRALWVGGNPLKSPPPEIVNRI